MQRLYGEFHFVIAWGFFFVNPAVRDCNFSSKHNINFQHNLVDRSTGGLTYKVVLKISDAQKIYDVKKANNTS